MKVLVTGGTGFIGASVVRNLLARGAPVVIGEYARDDAVLADLPGADFELVDVADPKAIEAVFARHPDLTHCIHLAYLMSAEVEADMARGVTVNLLGMVNMFEAAAAPQADAAGFHEQRDGVRRLAIGLRRSAGGRGRLLRTERSFLHLRRDEDPRRIHGAQIRRQARRSASPARVLPSSSGMAASGARSCGRRLSRPSRRSAASPTLPFSRLSRDTWIYKDDCAEQLVRLALKPSLSHFAYNNGGASVTAEELAAAVRHWLPDAKFKFDETKPTTPLIDRQDGARIEAEIGFAPRSLLDGVRAHINEARKEAGLAPVGA